MTPPTPMHAYQTITTARVMPPAAPTRPAAYATRMAQHIGLGKTPAQAMAAIERADGHMGRIPVNLNTDNCGGRGNIRPHQTEPLTTRIIAHLSADQWQPVNDEFAVAVRSTRNSINEALRKMRAQGRVKYLSQPGKRKSLWRLA
jgi:hypothetical protein